MKFVIKHEIEGTARIHLAQQRMSFREADILLYFLEHLDGVKKRKYMSRPRML